MSIGSMASESDSCEANTSRIIRRVRAGPEIKSQKNYCNVPLFLNKKIRNILHPNAIFIMHIRKSKQDLEYFKSNTISNVQIKMN